MITGYNTDVEHDGVIYHVQTEDKGIESPMILSLVYSGGAILASKRATYEDLIAAGFDEQVLAERLKRQHRLICAAIHAGRIADLKRMGGGEAAASTAPPNGQEIPVPPEIAVPPLPELPVEVTATSGQEEVHPVEPPSAQPTFEVVATPLEEELLSSAQPTEPPADEIVTSIADELLSVSTPIEPPAAEPPEEIIVTTIAEEMLLQAQMQAQKMETPSGEPPREVGSPFGEESPAASQSPVSDSRRESPLGESRPADEGLTVSLLDNDEFQSGDKLVLRVMVGQHAGANFRPTSGAQVSVKVLGTTFRPVIQTVKTGQDGIAIVPTQIPHFTSGRAAILIRATAGAETTEIRRVIVPAQ
ncbi:MAG TPA: hypothetical protein VMM84_02600 [Pyrinomonadaceae bacterium]|nr:hypothetical protein [Pyrinomonadaceae bacterium]